ncbi:Elongator subunit elp4 [Friedmanniomyces endolithicus]|uniref:Elongator complex protein 4 n=1 Tax=Rachicladosporium monterosium TaxID=1507873 RepID=A0ABR0L6B1_9PEZI|nr:Elongator subunit elp4 [Friedmanniomyces endolithicus]KAK1085949.1 Elongator subunit elp4 [Friedmanniomyces endolithicus]KAK1812205.1 Elongator subunit elp4 [Friedmanniomyces endolithicus]KAK5144207.1 Elongator subunit elp4 [Rachicladosporium monterosium]
MAFRKRNVVVGRGPPSEPGSNSSPAETATGVRPSPLTSHSVTSTGTPSLDDILGGHSGLPLGSSLLIEESGTTDFAGALLRFYAAEGVCHGHIVHIVGLGDAWVRGLPGIAEEKGSRRKAASADVDEKMKIAWRYERLGQAGERALPDRSISSQETQIQQAPFSHSFDLSKRLVIPTDAKINSIPIKPTQKPFDGILSSLTHSLNSTPSHSVHRLVIPSILSPVIWPADASRPEHFLRFLHSLRVLLVQYSTRLTAMITLPLELFPRSSGSIRWAELICDGVLELTPFPHLMDASNSPAESGGARGIEEQPQGMLKVHKLPINTERGEGGAGAGNSIGADLAFTVSRRKFLIQPFSLPPVEGDQEAQKDAGKLTGKDVEF